MTIMQEEDVRTLRSKLSGLAEASKKQVADIEKIKAKLQKVRAVDGPCPCPCLVYVLPSAMAQLSIRASLKEASTVAESCSSGALNHHMKKAEG